MHLFWLADLHLFELGVMLVVAGHWLQRPPPPPRIIVMPPEK